MPRARKFENLLPPPSVDCAVQKALETPFFTVGSWPTLAWWEAYNFPELNALIAEALATNPTIKEMEARIVEARQEAVIAHAPLLPLVTFDAKDTVTHLSKNGLYRLLNPTIPLNASLLELTLNFTYEFDFWGKNTNHFLAALGRKLSQEAQTAQVRLITVSALAQAFFALKADLVRKHLYEELVAVRSQVFDLQTFVQKKALSSALEPLLFEQDLAEAKRALARVEADIAADYHLINILAGRGPCAPLCIDATLPDLPKCLEIPENISCDLLARRPDLMAQIWLAEAEAREVGVRMAAFYPSFNLRTFFGLESVFYNKLFSPRSMTWGAVPAIHLPIFTAGALRAGVKGQTARFDAAVFAYDTLLLRSAQEVADLITLSESLFKQKVEQEQAVESAYKRVKLAVLRREKGLSSTFEDYAFQEEWIGRQLDDVTLLFQEYVASIKLAQALGGGYWVPEAIPL